MDYTQLGKSNLEVSKVCLGTMHFGSRTTEEDSFAIMDKALEMGINFFDTANIYAYGTSEEFLGRALKDFANRDEVVIATSVNPNDDVVEALAERVAIVDHGRLVVSDTLDALLRGSAEQTRFTIELGAATTANAAREALAAAGLSAEVRGEARSLETVFLERTGHALRDGQ